MRLPPHITALILVALVFPGVLRAESIVDSRIISILNHYQDRAGRAQAAYRTATAVAARSCKASEDRADRRATDDLTSLAHADADRNDLTGTAAAWREVLRLDPDHLQARAFFMAADALDATLDALAAPAPAADLLGNSTTGSVLAQPGPVIKILQTCNQAIQDARAAFSAADHEARKRFVEAERRLRDQAISDLKDLIRSSLHGDMAATAQAWKAVLRLDPAQTDARDFFTAMGSMTQVLADAQAHHQDWIGPVPQAPMPSLGSGHSALIISGLPRPSEGEAVLMAALTHAGWSVRRLQAKDTTPDVAAHQAVDIISDTVPGDALNEGWAVPRIGLVDFQPARADTFLPGINVKMPYHEDLGVVLAGSPLTGSAQGTFQVYNSKARMLEADSAPAADIVARSQSGAVLNLRNVFRSRMRGRFTAVSDLPHPIVMVALPGAWDADAADAPGPGSGIGRRLMPFACLEDVPRLTGTGWKLLLSAISWCAQRAPAANPPLTAPAPGGDPAPASGGEATTK